MKKDDMPKTDAERKAQREAWQDKHYTKQIPCPEHPKGRHTAILYEWGHRYAGMWECPKTGVSDSHEHVDYEIEEIEHPSSNPDSSYYWTEKVYVCGGQYGCGVVIEDEDPELDRQEAIADMQIMEARGK